MSEIASIIQKDSGVAASNTSLLGARGEALAVEHLIAAGYRIVMTNFTVPVGRNRQGARVTGEIDIIALDGETLCFVEVKARTSEEFLPAITNVDLRKQRQITRTARVYRRIFNVRDMPHRFDAVTVLIPDNERPQIELVRNFWSENRFQNRAWSLDRP